MQHFILVDPGGLAAPIVHLGVGTRHVIPLTEEA
jgi:hypothetical protein